MPTIIDYLLSNVSPMSVAPIEGDKGALRKFTGIANSGKPFYYYGTRAILELDSVQLSDKVPALSLHDRNLRLGFGVLSVEGNELIINGTLLSNDEATRLAKDADDGFPFQLSTHLSTSDYTDLKEGETATVNGQVYHYPLRILKNCTVPEVSFTPTGVDRETVAMILSQSLQTNLQETPMSNQTPPQATPSADDTSAQRIAELEQQVATLTAENAKHQANEKRAKVDAQLSQAGFTKNEQGEYVGVSATTFEMLLSLDDDKATALINDIKPKTGNVNYLLSEQHGSNIPPMGTPTESVLIANAKARKA